MALIVPTVCRYAVNGVYLDRPVANILDFEIDTTGTAVERDDFIYNTAGNIINSWVEHVVPIVVPGYEFTSVSWVDLNSANGSTGFRTSTSEHTLPVSGEASGDPTSGNVAVLVTKQIQGGRGRRNGRMFVVGQAEQGTSGNVLDNNRVTNLQGVFSDLLTELNDEGGITGPNRTMCVVHTTVADPDNGTHTNIESLNVQSRLATQRRRLRS